MTVIQFLKTNYSFEIQARNWEIKSSSENVLYHELYISGKIESYCHQCLNTTSLYSIWYVEEMGGGVHVCIL